MDSLLGHLYSNIKGAPEDIATESLCYIISNSQIARKVFIKYICGISQKKYVDMYDNDLIFNTQVVGENKERPDMVGINEQREEVLIIEAKFWAYLTENQPVEYIKRLEKSSYEGLKTLSFICPGKRVSSLWAEIERRLKDSFNNIDEQNIKNKDRVILHNDEVKINIHAWDSIINTIKKKLIAEKSNLLSDIEQLEGLCTKIDEEAFLPIKDEELGIDVAKRIYGYYNLLD